MIIGIAERQIGDVPLQVFDNVREGIGRILAQKVDVGLVRADMTEISNAYRGYRAFLAQPNGSATFFSSGRTEE